jgi:hypothetical protein
MTTKGRTKSGSDSCCTHLGRLRRHLPRRAPLQDVQHVGHTPQGALEVLVITSPGRGSSRGSRQTTSQSIRPSVSQLYSAMHMCARGCSAEGIRNDWCAAQIQTAEPVLATCSLSCVLAWSAVWGGDWYALLPGHAADACITGWYLSRVAQYVP